MLRDKIQKASIDARKSKNSVEISALNSIKTAVTNADKQNKNVEVSDEEIYKIINKLISQRQDSVVAFTNGGNIQKANDESAEIEVLKQFLPVQMSEQEIRTICTDIYNSFTNLPENARIGKTIGEFNKLYVGKADKKIVMDIVKTIF